MTERYDEVAVFRPDGTVGPSPEECLAECRKHVSALQAMVTCQRERITLLETQIGEVERRELVHETREALAEPTKKLEPPALDRLTSAELLQLIQDTSALVRRVAAEHTRRGGHGEVPPGSRVDS